MCYTRRQINEYLYQLNHTPLLQIPNVTDFGVLLDAKLSFTEHIEILSEANKSYDFIIRNCQKMTCLRALKTLYCGYVLSKLEYTNITDR